MKNTSKLPNHHLLENQQVVEEIRRHLWIESEKSGYDIGYEAAACDWLKRFSVDWMKHYMSSAKSQKSKASEPRSAVKKSKPSVRKVKAAVKKSPAKKAAKKAVKKAK